MSTGNCPETPRQKMIGMMYLFYTALLALNVSGEIINAFVLVNDSLEKTTESFNEKTQGLYSKLSLLANTQEDKYGATWDEAQVVRERTNHLVADVQRLKVEMVKHADGEEGDINNIKKKDNLDAGPEIMIGETGPKKGDSLRMWVENYRAFMLSHVSDTITNTSNKVLYHSISTNLGTPDYLDHKEEPKTWEEKLFTGMPLVGSIAMMTKLQADIRNAEADLIERMISGVDELDITISSVEALVSSNTNYVVKGGDFEASVFIGARDTTMKPTIFYSTKYPFYDTVKNDDGTLDYKMRGEMGIDYDTLELKDGKGIYALKNIQANGIQQWGGIIQWNTKQGTKNMPFRNEYMVGETGFAISPSGVNVFYRGIDNPVEVSVSGYPKERVQAFMSGGGSLVASSGAYVARITSPSARKVTISVSVKMDDGSTKNLGSKEFRVLNVPVPPAKLNGTVGEGRVHKNDILNGQLLADLGDQFFPFKVKFDVVSFRFAYKVRGQTKSISVNGNRLNAEAKQALQGLGRGTRVSFESIRVKGPSGTFQTAPVSLELR
jgi:gliding motility-associated protein GldM